MNKVFDNQTADGNSTTFKHLGSSRVLNVYVAGSLGGGTVVVEAQTPDEAEWVPLAGGEIIEPGMHAVFAAPFVGRLSLSGATAASVDAWIETDDAVAQDRVYEA